MRRVDRRGYPRAHRPLLPAVGRAMMRLSGWTVNGALPEIPKFIIIVAPHTSNWDFFVGLAALFALDLEAHWFGKDSLFTPPVGFLLRMIGGRAVRRDSPEGVVAETAAIIRGEAEFVLAIAPEGTRSSVDHWRTGFYRIAEAAEIPMVAVAFDWSRREIAINAPMRASGHSVRPPASQTNPRPSSDRHSQSPPALQ